MCAHQTDGSQRHLARCLSGLCHANTIDHPSVCGLNINVLSISQILFLLFFVFCKLFVWFLLVLF